MTVGQDAVLATGVTSAVNTDHSQSSASTLGPTQDSNTLVTVLAALTGILMLVFFALLLIMLMSRHRKRVLPLGGSEPPPEKGSSQEEKVQTKEESAQKPKEGEAMESSRLLSQHREVDGHASVSHCLTLPPVDNRKKVTFLVDDIQMTSKPLPIPDPTRTPEVKPRLKLPPIGNSHWLTG